MQTRVKAWVLPIFMLAIIARAPAQDLSSLSGSYGFQVVANQIDSLGSSGGAVIGVFNFDGAGHVSGTAIVKGRNGTPNDAFTGQGGVSGLYTVNPDSTGTMTLQFEFGFSPTLAFTITEGGRALLFVDGPGSTRPQTEVSPAFNGSPTSLSGTLPGAYLFGGSGNIPLTFTRTSSDGPIYSITSPVTGNGTVTCNDGSTGRWVAQVPVATAVVTNDGGNFFLVVAGNRCDRPNINSYYGFASLTSTANGGASLVLRLTGSLTPGSARAIGASATLNGTYGFQFVGQPFPDGQVGSMKFDGNGGVTASFMAVGGITPLSGTYSTNSDGTGTLTLTATANPSAAPSTFAFVPTDDGSALYLLRTSGGANGLDVSAGIARLQ